MQQMREYLMCRTIYRYDGTGADENRNASDY